MKRDVFIATGLMLIFLIFAVFLLYSNLPKIVQTFSVKAAQVNSSIPESALVEVSGNSKNYSVGIVGFAFSPNEITINQGDSVIWINHDPSYHSITGNTLTNLKSGTLKLGQGYSYTFLEKGTFTYHCSYHNSMTGKIIVQ